MDKIRTYFNINKAKRGQLFLLKDNRVFEFQCVASYYYSLVFGSIDSKNIYLFEDDYSGAILLDKKSVLNNDDTG